jgi:hypothetical protein
MGLYQVVHSTVTSYVVHAESATEAVAALQCAKHRQYVELDDEEKFDVSKVGLHQLEIPVRLTE